MRSARTIRIAALLALLLTPPVRADEPIGAWVEREPGGAITVHLWFFWTRSCPHCLEAKAFVETLASEPGVAVHALEL
ncbi:MAG: hypothetical protein NTZ61_20395, partial [Proteobacteria bacterium]|nr:hypothetical protein [Pseudomonadota bacterium]